MGLETNDSPKLSVLQALNNQIHIFLINPNIILYCVFLLHIYEYLKYHQHQCYHNQLNNHRHVSIIMFLFILLTVKSFETLFNPKEVAFTSGTFALNLDTSTTLTNL